MELLAFWDWKIQNFHLITSIRLLIYQVYEKKSQCDISSTKIDENFKVAATALREWQLNNVANNTAANNSLKYVL